MNGQMACCSRCFYGRDEVVPLIATFAFSKSEFYCLECGGLFGWLDPHGVDPSPDVDARHEALKAEWDELTGQALIGGGLMLKSCETCTLTGERHWNHATDAEKDAHHAAVNALRARAGLSTEQRGSDG